MTHAYETETGLGSLWAQSLVHLSCHPDVVGYQILGLNTFRTSAPRTRTFLEAGATPNKLREYRGVFQMWK